MIRFSIVFLMSAAAVFGVMGQTPVLHYDFTGGTVQVKGKYAAPQTTQGSFAVSRPQKGFVFNGVSFMTVPASMNLSFDKAITLYALVKFSEPEKPNRDMDMIFFKNGDFLLGRDKEKIYVNFCSASVGGNYNRSWKAACIAPGVPANRWTVLTAVAEKVNDRRIRITAYIDGDMVKSRIFAFSFHKPEKTPLTIGKGWGGPWFLNGVLGRVMIFDRALSQDEIMRLVMNEKYVSVETFNK